MANLNKVMLIGNLGADPEVRSTTGGAQVANFRIAITERWTDQSGQKQERTEWVTIVAWRKQAEIAQRFLRKGSSVYVEGKLQTRSWEDKNGGGKRYATEVICDRFQMLDRNQGGHEGSQESFGGQGFGGSTGHSRGGVDDFGGTHAAPAHGDEFIPPAGGPDDDLPF